MSFTDEDIARIAHGAAVELAVVLGGPAVPPWSSAPPKQVAAEATLVKAARFGASPEAVHEKRMQLDPDLPPFDQLSPGDRAKDYLFAGICAAMNEASDVKTRAENEQLALAEAERVTGNQAHRGAPFGGAQPIGVEAPRAPAQGSRED